MEPSRSSYNPENNDDQYEQNMYGDYLEDSESKSIKEKRGTNSNEHPNGDNSDQISANDKQYSESSDNDDKRELSSFKKSDNYESGFENASDGKSDREDDENDTNDENNKKFQQKSGSGDDGIQDTSEKFETSEDFIKDEINSHENESVSESSTYQALNSENEDFHNANSYDESNNESNEESTENQFSDTTHNSEDENINNENEIINNEEEDDENAQNNLENNNVHEEKEDIIIEKKTPSQLKVSVGKKVSEPTRSFSSNSPRSPRRINSKTRIPPLKMNEINDNNSDDNSEYYHENEDANASDNNSDNDYFDERQSKPSTSLSSKTISIDQIAQMAILDGDFSLVTDLNVKVVVSKIRQVQRDALNEGNYEFAEQAQAATQLALQHVNNERYLAISSSKTEDVNQQLQATKNDLIYLKEHWANVLQNAKTQANQDLELLQQENDNELKEFDMMIQSELPIQYRKPSSTLLNLRRKQKAMVSSNRWLEAKEVKKEADKLERIERTQNIEKFKKKQEVDRIKLIKKLDNKFSARQQNWIRTIEGIQRVAKYEIDHASKCAKQLESRIKSSENLSTSIRQQTSHSHTARARTVTPTVTPAQEFRQRAMINRITYSHIVVPKIKRPHRTSR